MLWNIFEDNSKATNTKLSKKYRSFIKYYKKLKSELDEVKERSVAAF